MVYDSLTSDTETIVKLIAKSKRATTIDKIIDTLFQIQGGYALVMIAQNTLIGVRDPHGIRPLVIGKLKNSYVFTSETCALDIIGAKFIREVENGEVVYIEDDELKSLKPFPLRKKRPCIFEYIYFSRPDSLLDGITAYEYRKKLGAELSKEDKIKADLVVPVPDSGNAAAIGYSQSKNIKFDLGLIRNHYVGRTFIEPAQKIRSLGVKLKLNANKSSIKNKIVVFNVPEQLINAGYEADTALIKRVIGIPGDKVEVRDGNLYLNDIAQKNYVFDKNINYSIGPFIVPEESLWVMGDNRNNSMDSHIWGFLPYEKVFGKAIYRYWPFNKIGPIRFPSLNNLN